MAHDLDAYAPWNLPLGIRSRVVDNHNGCAMHVLEAGHESPHRPCILLLHGFPELAYSWRRQLVHLSQAGYHVIAPDLRGFGRSGGTMVHYEDDLRPFSSVNRVADALGLVRALGHQQVALVVGHDYGAHVAGWCALLRPDVFRSVAFMSATFPGAPSLPLQGEPAPAQDAAQALVALGALSPPRKHYWPYFASPLAHEHLMHPPQGLHSFLRAYFHMKSGDWEDNQPFPLQAWSSAELAKLPRYYVMDADRTMPESVAPCMPSTAQIAACEWLSDADLDVYVQEYARTGFQGGLQLYRVMLDTGLSGELRAFAGRTVDVPALFLSGARDWGNHQVPGGLERLRESVCTRMEPPRIIPRAGHWVQQEAAAEVNAELLGFLERHSPRPVA